METGLRFGAPQRSHKSLPGRWRVLALVLLAALLAGLVWTRLAYWQVVRHVDLAASAQAQYREVVELPALRGAIFDRNLKQLVVNTTVYSAFVSPDQVPDNQRARVALALATVLGADAPQVNEILASGKKFSHIARRFSKGKADQLRSMALPAVGPEQGLADGVKKANAESGRVLIMVPATGGIIAWADYPSYNANDFIHTDPAHFLDNISSSVYEPGSVMKVVTLSGAINAGAITPDMVINDPGFLYVGGYRIYDWDRRNHGNITYTYVLEHSLNVGAMKAMQAEGHANFYNYLQAFGLTKASGIDVAAEDTIPPPSAAKMADSQFATSAFGQGIDVNMIQMLAAINVVANGGTYEPPHLGEP